MDKWTIEVLVQVIGVLFSLAFSFIPGLREWFDALDKAKKFWILVGLAALVSAGVFGLSCWTPYTYVTCDWPGVIQLWTVFLAFVTANQATYLLTRKLRPAHKSK